MQYRREIDGLRAIAVLPVILFHAGFDAFSGGFVGVDVFFVISGYLITTIIISELAQGKFSIAGFYERRARRILPALFFVMLACLPFAWLWLPPAEMKDFSQSLIAVSTFASNILFWQESGYFDTSAELKPLLHTWSLAVEEQYYILFPFLLMLTWRTGQRRLVALLASIAAISLALAHWASAAMPSAAFYLLPTRGWELLIGALAAIHLSSNGRTAVGQGAQEIGSLAGLSLLLFSVLAFDGTTPFPSLYTLAPTIGTALVILYASQDSLVGRLLGWRPLVGIGLISYSAYLWHQPLFAFARMRNATEPGQAVFAALALTSLALAYFSWRFIEAPFRNRLSVSRRSVFSAALLGTCFFIAIGALGINSNGFEKRFELPDEITSTLRWTRKAKSCFAVDNIHEAANWTCPLGSSKAGKSFFVFGDSHAASLLDVFDEAATAIGESGELASTRGCTPFLGLYSLRNDQKKLNCKKLNERVFDHVIKNRIPEIWLVARWTYYTDGSYSGKDFSFIGLTPAEPKSKAASRRAFLEGFEETIERYTRAGVRIRVVLQVPQQQSSPSDIIYRSAKRGKIDTQELRNRSVSLEMHRKLQDFNRGAFKKHLPEVQLISLDDVFCDGTHCLVGDSRGSYYADDDHLSVYGAARARGRIQALLAE